VTHGWGKSDVYFQDLHELHPTWRALVEGREGLFDAQPYRQTIYVRSTEGVPRGELFAVDPSAPERAAWKRLVPERADATLTSYQILGHRLVLRYLQDVTTRIEVRELDGTLVRTLPSRIGDVSWLEGTPDTDVAYYATHSYDPSARSTRLFEARRRAALLRLQGRHQDPHVHLP
jgi:prolyl oligopeptidase